MVVVSIDTKKDPDYLFIRLITSTTRSGQDTKEVNNYGITRPATAVIRCPLFSFFFPLLINSYTLPHCILRHIFFITLRHQLILSELSGPQILSDKTRQHPKPRL